MGSYALLVLLVGFYLALCWIDKNPENKKRNQEELQKMLEKYHV